MPLNISIDVDGTILDANEKLLPHARESIQLLKDAGDCLQLWSAGGADYAYKHALKNKLTDLFESYAKKPDVAIDDLPETARPLAVVHVDKEHPLDQAVKKVLSIEQNVDAALTLNSELVAFVGELQANEIGIQEQYRAILCPAVPLPLHPIPFFGVIDKARAITVGLNPSPTEFTEANRWPQFPYTPYNLTRRLVDYFRLHHTAPHYWFADLQWSLEILHCPYTFAAAHIDASPWTTHAPYYLRQNHPHLLPLYNELLADGVQNWLPRTLGFCKDTVKLVIICPASDTPGHIEAARLQVIEQTIRHLLGQEWNGEIVIKPKNLIPRWAWENRERLIRLLDLENVLP
jgi:hypothetical protein